MTNCSLLRECGALTAVHEALKCAGERWTIVRCVRHTLQSVRKPIDPSRHLSSIPEPDNAHNSPFHQNASPYASHGHGHQPYPGLSPQERQEYLEEINGELAVHLSILYFLVEIGRGDEAWADELSQ